MTVAVICQVKSNQTEKSVEIVTEYQKSIRNELREKKRFRHRTHVSTTLFFLQCGVNV